MCGIVGYCGSKEDGLSMIMAGLKRLEYRGYDSAGVAAVADGKTSLRKAAGKLSALFEVLAQEPLTVHTGIGHIRWATHGMPTTLNAHPIQAGNMTLVHNGIIENYQRLQIRLRAEGVMLATETDTEVIPQLVQHYREQGHASFAAFRKTLSELEGAFALAMLDAEEPDRIYIARQGSPLAIGVGKGKMFVGSDAMALAHVTSDILYLEEGDYGYITETDYVLFDTEHQPVRRPVKHVQIPDAVNHKGPFKHYMLKEIWEQPECIARTLSLHYQHGVESTFFADIPLAWDQIPHLTFLACGTSYYTAMVAKYWIEAMAGVPVSVEIASEFRYRHPVVPKQSLVVGISQSGETADTLAALKQAKAQGNPILVVVNARETSMERLADYVLYTDAKPEIGVAATKTFTTQLLVLGMLALQFAQQHQRLPAAEFAHLNRFLQELPTYLREVLTTLDTQVEIVSQLRHASSVLFVARGALYPIALEGALKLKELAYIHAEATPAGEFKHGPLAMVDAHIPIILLIASGPLLEKTVSNAQEIAARQGKMVAIGDAAALARVQDICVATVPLPDIPELLQPILYTLPLQLLAYYVADSLEHDVDQPRNLAKSVTVE